MGVMLIVVFIICLIMLIKMTYSEGKINDKELKRMRVEFDKRNPVKTNTEPIRKRYAIKGYDGEMFYVEKYNDEKIDFEFERKFRQQEIEMDIAHGEYIQSLTPEEFAKYAENNPLVRDISKNNK